MKKTYIRPAIEVTDVNVTLCAASFGSVNNMGAEQEALAKRSRGFVMEEAFDIDEE